MGHNEEEKLAGQGDIVQGDKNVTSKTVYGDSVGGDKIGGDKITYNYPSAPKEPPMQIPRRARYFQGREALIADVLAELQPGRVVSLMGIGGIGKTAVLTTGNADNSRINVDGTKAIVLLSRCFPL